VLTGPRSAGLRQVDQRGGDVFQDVVDGVVLFVKAV
jgi:hypothetical protein